MAKNETIKKQIEERLKYLKEMGIDYMKISRILLDSDKKPVEGGRKKSENIDLKASDKGALRGKESSQLLSELRSYIGDCTRCTLSKERKSVVFGSGSPQADLMFIGEAPGFDEDIQGLPFVGRAGQLLTKIINAIEMDREQVYIANIIKCRPPGNRNPLSDEIETCVPFLHKQIGIIRPKIIIALGTFAAQTILNTKLPITSLRGRFMKFKEISVMPTFHPAFLLRNQNRKREVWDDMKLVVNELKRLESMAQ